MLENDWVAFFRKEFSVETSGLSVGIGDDAAVIDGFCEAGEQSLVLSTDMLVENGDFRKDWLTPEEVGWKAFGAACSDLAAMGAQPLSSLVSLAIPTKGWSDDDVKRISAEMGRRAKEWKIPIVGGDLSRIDGPLVIDVSVVGRCATGRTWRRGGAKAGDRLWLTRAVGRCGRILRRLLQGESLGPEERAPWACPTPRWDFVEILNLNHIPVHACMDVSDGLAADLDRLAEASQVSIEICGVAWAETPVEEALCSAEEYQLVLALPPEVDGEELGLVPLGRVEAPSSLARVFLQTHNKRVPISSLGFDHFAEKR